MQAQPLPPWSQLHRPTWWLQLLLCGAVPWEGVRAGGRTPGGAHQYLANNPARWAKNKTKQNRDRHAPLQTLVLHVVVFRLTECPTDGPAACHQLCTVSENTYTCSCMPGFKLQSDERSCLPEGLAFKNTHKHISLLSCS